MSSLGRDYMRYQNAMSLQRFLAFIIDSFIINLIATLILNFIPLYVFHAEKVTDMTSGIYDILMNADLEASIALLKSSCICLLLQTAIFVPLMLAYQVCLPMFWKAQTVGRLIAGVRVMKLNSDEKPGFGSLLIRELVGGYIFNTMFIQSMVFPILNYVFSRNRGRSLADMISKTRLIDYKLAKMQGLDEETFEANNDFINAEYNEINKEEYNKDDVDTDYKVF